MKQRLLLQGMAVREQNFYVAFSSSDPLPISPFPCRSSHVGAVTSSVLNTAKRVIIIVVSAFVFQEAMERNTVIGSAIAIGGTFAYSLTSTKKVTAKVKAT